MITGILVLFGAFGCTLGDNVDNIENLSAEITQLKNLGLKDEVTFLKSDNQKLMKEIDEIKNNYKDRRLMTNNVGFTAYMTGGLEEVVAGTVISFDAVVRNEGDGYNPENSYFYCPVSGFYVFHVSLFADRMHTTDQIGASLYMGLDGGSEVVGVISHKQGTEDIYMTASNSAYVYCEQDEPVWVESIDEGQVCGDTYGVRATVFSGFLVALSAA